MIAVPRTCRRCGFHVPADAAVCGGCGRPAIDGWRSLARRLPGGRRPTGYRPAFGAAARARAALTLLSATAVADAAAFAVRLWAEPDAHLELPDGRLAVDDLASITSATVLGAAAVTGLAVLAWSLRSIRNRRHLAGHPVVRSRRRWRDAGVAAGVLAALGVLAWTVARGWLEATESRTTTSVANAAAAGVLALGALGARRSIALATIAAARRAETVIDLRDRHVVAARPPRAAPADALHRTP